MALRSSSSALRAPQLRRAVAEPGRVRGEGLHFSGILPGLAVLFGDGEPERLDLLGQGFQVLIEGIAVVADLGELAHWHAAGDKEDGQGHPHGRLTGHHDVKVAHSSGP